MKIILLTLVCLSVVFAHPNIRVEAEECTPSVCKLENNCACSSPESPLGDASITPQFVTLTFDDSVTSYLHDTYIAKLLFNRKNADGSTISATFYVPHEYTDYSKVNNLYNKGFDISVNSINRRKAESPTDKVYEQRVNINIFANIPIDDIQGVRTPYSAVNGDSTFEAYVKAGLKYDNSMPTSYNTLLYPYTLDYKSTRPCLVAKCPTSSFPGFWVHPITHLLGDDGVPCSALSSCNIENSSAVGIRNWLIKQFNRHRNGTKAPQTFLIHSAFFVVQQHAFEGFQLFLDYLETLKDTFLVSHREVNRWARNPVPLGTYEPAVESRNAPCERKVCEVPIGEYEVRYMVSCTICPDEYL